METQGPWGTECTDTCSKAALDMEQAQKQETQVVVMSLQTLRFLLGVLRTDRERSEDIIETNHAACFGENVTVSRLRWCGQAQSQISEDAVGRRMLW